MKAVKVIDLKNPIVKIEINSNENSIGIADESGSFREIDVNEFKLVSGFKINLEKPLRTFSNSVAISNSLRFIAICLADKNEVGVWGFKNKKLLRIFKRHSGEVESVQIDNKDHYIATGGTDGKVFLWNVKTGRLASSLAPHADYVTAISFSENSMWIATGSYDKSLNITNIANLNKVSKLRGHSGAITSIKFLKNLKLVSGDKNGEVIIWDYSVNKLIKKMPKMLDVVTSFCVTNDQKYLFASSKNGYIALYNLESGERLNDTFIKHSSAVTSMQFLSSKNMLVMGRMDGFLLFYDLNKEQTELNHAIKDKLYSKAYELVEKNPMLLDTKEYKLLEATWHSDLKQAEALLETGERDSVSKLLKPYMDITLKRAFIQKLLREFKEFEKFKFLVESRKFPLAYSMANLYTSFRQTSVFMKMEGYWRTYFNKAKDIMFKKGAEEDMKSLLAPFRGIPEKTALIQSLFQERETYNLFMLRLGKKDFKNIFLMAKQFPFIQELDEYNKIQTFADNLMQKCEQALKEGRYNEAVRNVQILTDFPDFEERAKNVIKLSNLYANLMNEYANKRYLKVYQMVDEYPFLEETLLYNELESSWFSIIDEIEKMVAIGDVEAIKQRTDNYSKVKSKIPKIVQTIRSAHFVQIEDAIKTKNLPVQNILSALQRYVEIYGYDDDLTYLVEIAKSKYNMPIELGLLQDGDISKIFGVKELPNNIFPQ
ncbi:MAG: WD40 repeat domain-containing protein [Campylobacterales bacterium]|nr:WD40 repeat domain-containing protein [Campylobacterales bacterium]